MPSTNRIDTAETPEVKAQKSEDRNYTRTAARFFVRTLNIAPKCHGIY